MGGLNLELLINHYKSHNLDLETSCVSVRWKLLHFLNALTEIKTHPSTPSFLFNIRTLDYGYTHWPLMDLLHCTYEAELKMISALGVIWER